MISDPITPSDLRAWMERHRISRTTLAELLMISTGTVHNWFSGQVIGSHRQKHLRTLMEAYDLDATATRKDGNPDEETAFLADASLLSPQEQEYFEKAASLEHENPTVLLKKIIMAVCKDICREDGKEDI